MSSLHATRTGGQHRQSRRRSSTTAAAAAAPAAGAPPPLPPLLLLLLLLLLTTRSRCVARRVRITHSGLVITSVSSPAPAAALMCTSDDVIGRPLASAIEVLA